MLENKRIRRNIIDLKINYPEEFGKFIITLKSLMESDDWFRKSLPKSTFTNNKIS